MSKKKQKEDLPQDPKAALDGKVQTEDQQPEASMQLKAPVSVDPATIKEVDQPKPAINTKKAAEVVAAGSTSNSVGGAPLLRAAVVFGGSVGGIRDDESATTRENVPYRSGTRTGKRIDPITRKLDTTLAEMFRTEIRQSKPLSETNEKQGYNGNYADEHAITQKSYGGAPADPLFERSIDQINIDTVYFPQGQLIAGNKSRNLNIHTWNAANNNYDENPVQITLGNYLPRMLIIRLNRDGLISVGLQADDISPVNTDEATTRLASDAFIRFLNQSELDRNAMISVAGNESDPSWSCMGDAIIDPTDQNRFQRLFEATVGDFIYMADRNLQFAKSYQINKAAKDGLRLTGPMAEMLNHLVETATIDGAEVNFGAADFVPEDEGVDRAFDHRAYVRGGAGLFVAINDSLPKYTTKGKLMTLPLSIGSAVSTGLSNADPFVMDNMLATLCEKNELFSTIDGPYDPLKPIIVTDAKGIAPMVHPFEGGSVNISDDALEFTADSDFTIYVMHYENLRNKYNIRIRNYFAEGLWGYLSDRAGRIWQHTGDQAVDGVVTIRVPAVSCMCGFSLWDALIAAATPYMVEARLTTLTELLKYEKNHGYPYSGVSHLKDINFTASTNFSFSDQDAQLSSAIATPVAALKVIMPEVFWPTSRFEAQGADRHNGTGSMVVLPHYFVQSQFRYEDNADLEHRALLLSDDAATMAYPSIRSGSNLSFADTIYGMTEEDYRLALDRMVVYPAYEGAGQEVVSKFAHHRSAVADGNKYVAAAYKYGLVADGQPVLPYFVYANSASNANETLTVRDVMSTPRELGYMFVAPSGVLTPTARANGAVRFTSADASYFYASGPGFSARIYHTVGAVQQHEILGNPGIQIEANASFRNEWTTLYANPHDAGEDFGITLNSHAGHQEYMPFVGGCYDNQYGIYDPDTGTYEGNEVPVQMGNHGVNSAMKILWTRLQRLPFVVNPFDVNVANIAVDGNTDNPWADIINEQDPYDFMYIFGLCGFRSSDFSQLTYDRNRARIVMGMNYVSDPYVEKSMLLK